MLPSVWLKQRDQEANNIIEATRNLNLTTTYISKIYRKVHSYAECGNRNTTLPLSTKGWTAITIRMSYNRLSHPYRQTGRQGIALNECQGVLEVDTPSFPEQRIRNVSKPEPIIAPSYFNNWTIEIENSIDTSTDTDSVHNPVQQMTG